MVKIIICVIAYLILAPVIGGLLAGIDRVISARMQGRHGPSVFQPFYDFFKLLEKEPITVNNVQDFYIACFLLFIVVTGFFFFAGMDLLARDIHTFTRKHIPYHRGVLVKFGLSADGC